MTSIPVDTTYLIPGQQIDASDVVIPLIDLEHGIEGMLDGVYKFLKNTQVNAIPATLASDAFTAVQTFYAVNTQGGTNDELRTITRSGQVDMVILWKNTADPITITVRNSIGNILLDAGRDVVISDRNTALVLYWNATTSKWNGDLVTLGNIWLSGFPFTQIQSDTISITTPKVGVYAESGLTDNLATINHGVVTSQMDVIFLTAVNTYTITLKHNTGNLFFPSGRDVILDSTSDWAMLVWNDVTNKWHGQSSTELQAQKFQTPFAQLTPSSILEIPQGAHLLGSSAALGVSIGTDPVRLLSRNRPVMSNEMLDFAIGPTTFASFGATFTTTGTPTDAANTESQWVLITSGAVVGNKCGRAGTVGPRLQWSPYFEVSYLSYGNGIDSNGGLSVNYGGLIGLFNTQPAVNAAGITVWTGVSGIGFSYELIQPFLGNGDFRLIQVDNGVVTNLLTGSLLGLAQPPGIPLSQANSRPMTPVASVPILSFYVDFANATVFYTHPNVAAYGSVAITISPALANVALAPMIFDAARTAAAQSFSYRHMLTNWKT